MRPLNIFFYRFESANAHPHSDDDTKDYIGILYTEWQLWRRGNHSFICKKAYAHPHRDGYQNITLTFVSEQTAICYETSPTHIRTWTRMTTSTTEHM